MKTALASSVVFVRRVFAGGLESRLDLARAPHPDFMAQYEGRGRAVDAKAGSVIQLDIIDR